MRRIAPLIALLLLAAALPARASAASSPPLSTCFWEGPISTQRPTTRGFDGRNFNFPEESATYWVARFRIPAGSHLDLRGRFPHGRYMSLNAYAAGAPTDTLSDVAVVPRPGAINPFVAGHRRDRELRGWRAAVLDAPVPAGARTANTLYAQTGSDKPIELAYRVYEPDRGRDLTGGTGLPAITLVGADGSRVAGAAACARINDADRSIPVQTISPALWQLGTKCRPGHPAFDPVRWERFFNLDYATASVLEDCTEAGHQARLAMAAPLKGGLYSNRDSAYTFAHLSTNFGRVVVLHGRLPVFPHTRERQRYMSRAQLRFWSLCSGQSRVTTRTNDCLADRQVVLRGDRRYTIVVSKPEDRPANAKASCGVSWLDFGPGDGAGRSDYAVLIMRNMLVSPTFAQAIQRVPKPGQEAQVMGPYLPRTEYTNRAAFEALGCPSV
jgi:hypothetical protein